ncbi:hypothetical protein PISMIDRAFT_76599, partial [Pisolithus microcarpus 441]
CSRCKKDGVYRCVDCIHQLLCCTDCCCALHELHPLHWIQQWTGECFERSALHTLGLSIDLGHFGAPYWEDIEDIPLNLQPPIGSKYLTIVDVTGIHYMAINSCECLNAECYHL